MTGSSADGPVLRIQNCRPPLLPQQSAQTPWTVGLTRPQCGQSERRASRSCSALRVVLGGPRRFLLGREDADDFADGLGRLLKKPLLVFAEIELNDLLDSGGAE